MEFKYIVTCFLCIKIYFIPSVGTWKKISLKYTSLLIFLRNILLV